MLYCDLAIDDEQIWVGVPCMHKVFLNSYRYLKFLGDLVFLDVLGNTDPTYDLLTTRYVLFYVAVVGPDVVIVPLQDEPSQTFTTVLGGQNCRFRFYEKARL
jgi:hypothetical protein